jgi:hypothetical protein
MPEQYVRRYIVDMRHPAPPDLSGRTSLARLRLRVRFGVTDDGANVERWPTRAALGLGKGGIE